jgi:hypothetical protein
MKTFIQHQELENFQRSSLPRCLPGLGFGKMRKRLAYEPINAMLLNEFLKEHRKVREQANTIAELKNEIAPLAARMRHQAAQIQKVTSQLDILCLRRK